MMRMQLQGQKLQAAVNARCRVSLPTGVRPVVAAAPQRNVDRTSRCPTSCRASQPSLPPNWEGQQQRLEQIQAECDSLKYDELKHRLRERGLSATGRKQELADRLVQALLQERPSSTEVPPEEEFSPLDSTGLREELSQMELEQIEQALQDMGQSIEGDKAELVERLAMSIEADQAGQAMGADAAPGHGGRPQPASHAAPEPMPLAPLGVLNCGEVLTDANVNKEQLLAMSTSQLRKLKVDEMRVALAALGCDTSGQRFELSERLVDVVSQARPKTPSLTAPGSSEAPKRVTTDLSLSLKGMSAAGMADIVAGMGLRALRNELSQRGLNSTGSRAALEARLVEALQAESHTVYDNEEGDEEAEAAVVRQLDTLDPERRLMQRDPPVTVWVLFGAPGLGLDQLQASLDSARCIHDALHTAWEPSSLTAACAEAIAEAEAEAEEAGDEEAEEGGAQEAAPPAAAPSTTGVRVRCVYLPAVGQPAMEIAPEALRGLTAADLSVHSFALPDVADTMLEGQYASLAQLAAALKDPSGSPAVLLSALALDGLSPAGEQELETTLRGSGVGLAGGLATPLAARAVAANKRLAQQALGAHGFPVLPAWHMTEADLEQQETWASKFETWADKQGWHHDRQMFVVKPAVGSYGIGVTPVRGLASAATTAQALLQALKVRTLSADDSEAAPAASSKNAASQAQPAADCSVVIEPYMSDTAMHFSVTVLQGPGGPLALLPTEVVVADSDAAIFEAELQAQEWQMRKEGVAPEVVEEQVSAMRASADFQDQELLVLSHRISQPFTRVVQYRSPPRLPRKLMHAMRHGAALAFSQLGLRGAARFDGWVQMEPNWQDAYDWPDDGEGRLLPDQEPEIQQQMRAQLELEDRAHGPPMADYYDDLQSCTADLARFKPKDRLHASSNQEGTIFFTDVNPAVEVDPSAPVFREAAASGLTPAALLRNMVNAALREAAIQTAGAGATAAAPPAGKKRRSKKSDSEDRSPSPPPPAASPSVAADPPAVQLEAPPPLDPSLLAPGQGDSPDDFSYLQGVTEWRHQHWVMEKEAAMEQDHYNSELMRKAAVIDAALHPGNYEFSEDGSIGEAPVEIWEAGEAPPGVVDDWNEEIWDQEPDVADSSWVPGSQTEPDHRPTLAALRREFPALPEDDLMYVMLGRGPDGRAIDTDKLKAMLHERAQKGGTYLPSDFLDQCLIDPDTGAVGELPDYGSGPESEPGGFVGGDFQLDPEVAKKICEEEVSFANSLPEVTQKVWLLLGGSEENATHSLKAGLDIAMQLSKWRDLQVELFLLVRSGSGLAEERVRAALLKRRVEWQSLGMDDDGMTPAMALDAVRNVEPIPTTPQSELVWVLPLSAAMQHSAAGAHIAVERALKAATTAEAALPKLELQAQEAILNVQTELAAGGVRGVCGLWGGEPMAPPLPPRCMTLVEVAEEAANANALVVPMLRGWLGQTGIMQRLLEENGVPYTGSGPVTLQQCGNKFELLDMARGLGWEGAITNEASAHLTLAELLRSGSKPRDAVAQMEALLEALQADPEDGLAIKPAKGSGSVGLARLRTPEDFMCYVTAIGMEMPCIPADTMSYAPHPAIILPRFAEPDYLIEAWVPSRAVLVTPPASPAASASQPAAPGSALEVQSPTVTLQPLLQAEEGSEELAAAQDPTDTAEGADEAKPSDMDATGSMGWVEVTIGLLGNRGSVEPLGLSVTGQVVSSTMALCEMPVGSQGPDGEGQGDEVQGGTGVAVELQVARLHLCPAPEHVIPQVLVDKVLTTARDLADRAGVQGLVKLDAFLCLATGVLKVLELDCCPLLSADSPLFQQALLHPTSPLTPDALVRTVLNLGLSATRDLDASLMLREQELEGSILDGDEQLMEREAEMQMAQEAGLLQPGRAADSDDDDDGGMLASLQGPRMGGEDESRYFSSTGRANRRGARQDVPYITEGGSFGTSGSVGLMSREADYDMPQLTGNDMDFDGQGPEDPEYQSNWSMRNEQHGIR